MQEINYSNTIKPKGLSALKLDKKKCDQSMNDLN